MCFNFELNENITKLSILIILLEFYLTILEIEVSVNNLKTIEIKFMISILILKLLRDKANNKNKNLAS